MRLIDADKLNPDRMTKDGFSISQSQIANAPTVDAVPMSIIKTLGEEMRITQKSIKDESVLLGFNMAVALCNKHLESVSK